MSTDSTDCDRCNGTGKVKCPHIPFNYSHHTKEWSCKCGAFKIANKAAEQYIWPGYAGEPDSGNYGGSDY